MLQIECPSVDNVLPLALYGLCIEFSILHIFHYFNLSVIPSETGTSHLLLAAEDAATGNWKALDTLLELMGNAAKQIE